ncbi:MAG TPA: NADH-quinone oxidoreductase subunit F, partial [Chloroflexota bacterium]
LPGGELAALVGPLHPGRVGVGVTESPRGECIHWVRTGDDSTIDRYRVRSASYSNWPIVALAVPGNMVPDFPLINKSFELCYSCLDR